MFLAPMTQGHATGKHVPACGGVRIWIGPFEPSSAFPDIRESDYIALIPKRGKLGLCFPNGALTTVGPGDLMLMLPWIRPEKVSCQENAITGVLLAAEQPSVQADIARAAVLFSTDDLSEEKLRTTLERQDGHLVIRDEGWSASLMASLSGLRPQEKSGFITLKLLERIYLLLCGAEEVPERQYYDDYQMQAIRQVHDYMLSHLEQPLTIDFLAKSFQLSPTFLKSCFRRVYGEPIHTYLQRQRLCRGAQMLLETRDRIYEIAMAVGYSSASRFGVAFRAQYHMTPQQYRSTFRKNV